MRDIPELVDGYRRFLGERYPREAGLYRRLGVHGQAPKTMVLSCCDSRVEPAAIFDAAPGRLFVVRNVANLAPPYEPDGHYHATSAALEFAVTGLGVDTILVMGHGRCGGVQAFLDGLYASPSEQGFITKWMTLLEPAWEAIKESAGDLPHAERLTALEHAGVRRSIANLETFPFVAERVAAGTLKVRGAFFDIADGALLTMNPETGVFEAI